MTEVQEFWDRLYGEREQIWTGKVNVPLAVRVADLPSGRALDLGCGEGGDALWLAERGWTVTAVDISATALGRARVEAQRRGLVVGWQHRDLAEGLPAGPYDLVSAQFFQSPVELPREVVLRSAASDVVPGGHLLVVGHARGPSWAEHHADPALMPSAETVWGALALSPEWTPLEVVDEERAVTGPDGQAGHALDSIVLARRG